LLALTPPRPSATGTVKAPAVSTPRVGSAGFRLTVILSSAGAMRRK
jgi:hypothetical protein